MFFGDSASDMVAQGARNDAGILRGRLDNQIEANEKLSSDIDNLSAVGARHIAMRSALEAQLRIVDPGNDLINNKLIIDRIEAEARAAVKKTNDFNSAREVGRNFPIPRRVNPVTSRPKVQPPQLLPRVKNSAPAPAMSYDHLRESLAGSPA